MPDMNYLKIKGTVKNFMNNMKVIPFCLSVSQCSTVSIYDILALLMTIITKKQCMITDFDHTKNINVMGFAAPYKRRIAGFETCERVYI